MVAVFQWMAARSSPRRQLTELHKWSIAELQQALSAVQEEQRRRSILPTHAESSPWGPNLTTALEKPQAQIAHFRNVHKHTYASEDPKAAAYFMAKYFGGWCNHEPGHGVQQTHCNDSRPKPITWNVYYDATPEQPQGFSIHFVKNPRKMPRSPMSEWDLAMWLQKWRGNFSETGQFDQFMDNHLGLLFDTLDPLVEQWERDGVPFICRTWCCGPGMPQWPDRCPKDHGKDFPHEQHHYCEQGCYVEVPNGIIIEALCGLESYNASRKCLSRADSHLEVFDLCTDH